MPPYSMVWKRKEKWFLTYRPIDRPTEWPSYMYHCRVASSWWLEKWGCAHTCQSLFSGRRAKALRIKKPTDAPSYIAAPSRLRKFTDSFTNSFVIRKFIHSQVHLRIHSFTISFANSLIHKFILSYTNSFANLFIQEFIHSFRNSIINSFILSYAENVSEMEKDNIGESD